MSGRITGGELPAETFRWLMATLHEGKELDCKGRPKYGRPVETASR